MNKASDINIGLGPKKERYKLILDERYPDIPIMQVMVPHDLPDYNPWHFNVKENRYVSYNYDGSEFPYDGPNASKYKQRVSQWANEYYNSPEKYGATRRKPELGLMDKVKGLFHKQSAEDHFINGFVKQAAARGFSEEEALGILKKADVPDYPKDWYGQVGNRLRHFEDWAYAPKEEDIDQDFDKNLNWNKDYHNVSYLRDTTPMSHFELGPDADKYLGESFGESESPNLADIKNYGDLKRWVIDHAHPYGAGSEPKKPSLARNLVGGSGSGAALGALPVLGASLESGGSLGKPALALPIIGAALGLVGGAFKHKQDKKYYDKNYSRWLEASKNENSLAAQVEQVRQQRLQHAH